MQVLGKEVYLDTFQRRDSPARLQYVTNLINATIAVAATSATRRIETVMIQKVIGNIVFVTDTAATLRGLLNRTCACLRSPRGHTASAEPRRSSGPSKAATMLGFKAHGVEVSGSILHWLDGGREYSRLSHDAEAEWQAILQALPKVNG